MRLADLAMLLIFYATTRVVPGRGIRTSNARERLNHETFKRTDACGPDSPVKSGSHAIRLAKLRKPAKVDPERGAGKRRRKEAKEAARRESNPGRPKVRRAQARLFGETEAKVRPVR